MASAYLTADVQVSNSQQYVEYKKWSTITMQTHGAEICVYGKQFSVLEGQWQPTRGPSLSFHSCELLEIFTIRPNTSKPGKRARVLPSCARS